MRNYLVIGTCLLLMALAGCTSKPVATYENKPEYTITVGEEVRIYYSVNSCCQYCVLNQGSLRHVSLFDDIRVEDYPEDCAGCNATYAFVFKATSTGTDTIFLNMREASASCYDVQGEPEKFIVHVQ